MNERPLVPCLWFDDRAESAARFYAETFPEGRVRAVSRYPESFDNPGGMPRGSVLTVDFEIAGQRFTALNGGPHFVINPSISFFVRVATPAEADAVFARLAEGGSVMMPLGAYPWSERYGWVADRFGVSWQVIADRHAADDARIVPCLMFAGAQHGRAEAALETYAGIFPRGKVTAVERYAAGEGPEGTVKHGRIRVADQELIAMDSHVDQGFGFNEAVSFQVMCSDQQEVDRYWSALADRGQPGRCGWLKDRYGVSWQVVPAAMAEWLGSADSAARERTFRAMLEMDEPDITALRAAFDGR